MREGYARSPYFHVAHARDLRGWDYILFRFFEVLPGAISWGTILLVVVLSAFAPVAAAYFIIAFDLYWLLKTVYLGLHQRYNFRRMRHSLKVDWNERLSHLKYEHLYHMVLLPYYNESEEIVRASLESLTHASYDSQKILIVLASEARAGEKAAGIGTRMTREFSARFGGFLVTSHSDGLPGEVRGKGPNITFAAEEARRQLLDAKKIAYEDVIVSAFDIDTIIEPDFFLCLSWHFLTTEDPHRASFQPVPVYNNNIWDAPAVSRVAAFSSTFWQMIQQERPEKLTTFSSHAVSFRALYEVGYWQKNVISDDSRIFWNLFFAHDGNYRVVPIAYPVYMDANLAPTLLGTLRNIYKQHLRWMWGVENIPYMLFSFVKNKKIPLRTALHHTLVQIEGFWSLATSPIIILLLGWLPLILGGDAFRDTVLSYNLPYITRNLMIVAMLGLVLAAYIAFFFMPPVPKHFKRPRVAYVVASLQWLMVPFSIIIFGALPGLHAQTRLMFGRYMGAFWVTPKHRASSKLP